MCLIDMLCGFFWLCFLGKTDIDISGICDDSRKVKKGDVLCIIEAMKLMNEIESECDGEVKEILAKDAESVEYGKPLFRIG